MSQLVFRPMLAALLVGGIAGAIWVFLIAREWRRVEVVRPGRPMEIVLWILTVWTTLSTVATRAGWYGPVPAATYVAGVLLGAGAVAGRNRWMWTPFSTAVVAFGGFAVVSGLANGQAGPQPSFVAVLFLPAVALVTAGTVIHPDALVTLAQKVSAAVVVASAAVWIMSPRLAIAPGPTSERRWPIFGLADRIAGVTPHPNLLALTAGVCAITTLQLRPRAWRLVLCITAAMLVLSEARTVGAATLLAGTALWVRSGRHSARRMLLALPVAAAISLFLLAGGLQQIESSEVGAGYQSFNGRTDVWTAVHDHWSERPLTGWGPLAFDPRYHTPLSAPGLNNAHNQFVEGLAEAGPVGLALTVAIGLALMRAGLGARRPVHLAAAILLGVSMLTEVPLTVHQYNLNYVLLVAWLLVLLVVAGEREIQLTRRLRLLRRVTSNGPHRSRESSQSSAAAAIQLRSSSF